MGTGIKDEWEVTLTIKTLDGDPMMWDWKQILPDEVTVTKTSWKSRVLEDK